MKDTYIKKSIFLTIILLISQIPAVTFSQQSSLGDIYRKVSPAVFLIETFDDEDNLLGQGTGFFIKNNGIGISCFHVFINAKTARIRTKNGDSYSINRIIRFDEKKDIIQFSVTNSHYQFPYIEIDSINRDIGNRVCTVGNPFGLESTLTDGIISGLRLTNEYGKLIQISVPVSPGNSGSPLLSMDGQVLGIITSGIFDGQNLNFAVDIKELLSLHNTHETTFPEREISSIPKRDLEGAFIGLSKAKIEKLEKSSEIDGFRTGSWNSLYSINDVECIVYHGDIDIISCYVKYMFRKDKLYRIEYHSYGYMPDDVLSTINFETTVRQFVNILNSLKEKHGKPQVMFLDDYPWVKEEYEFFFYYSEWLKRMIKVHEDDHIGFKWHNTKYNARIELMISYSGLDRYTDLETGKWDLWITSE